MNTFLTVGTDILLKDKMTSVKDSDLYDNIKPSGGLWMTEFDMSIPNFNRWMDYIVANPHILFYKNKQSDPFHQPCSIIILKDSANIFKLDSLDAYNYLVEKYPKDNGFSFEKMSLDYDGINVNLFALGRSLSNKDMKLFLTFGTTSSTLFNLDCIDYYHSGMINIDAFDYESGINHFVSYNIEWESNKRYISDEKTLIENKRTK